VIVIKKIYVSVVGPECSFLSNVMAQATNVHNDVFRYGQISILKTNNTNSFIRSSICSSKL